jgi:FkbM family methyltransferase
VISAELEFYRRRVGPGMVVFDVGANRGDLSTLFAELVGSEGAVYAFEPGPAYDALAAVASRHPNLVPERLALFERDGEVLLNVYEGDTWSTLAERTIEDHGSLVSPVARVPVQAVTLDGYCAGRQIGRIDLLKLDVEGAELQVLRGARAAFGGGLIRSCTFEVGETTFDMGNDPHELIAFFASVGFRVENLVAGDPVFPGGGRIFSMHHAFRAE